MRTAIDFPELIAQAEGAGVDRVRELKINRGTLWRWRTRQAKPDGELAIELYVLVHKIERRRE